MPHSLAQRRCSHTAAVLNRCLTCIEVEVSTAGPAAIDAESATGSAAALLKTAADGQALVPKGEIFKAMKALDKAKLKVCECAAQHEELEPRGFAQQSVHSCLKERHAEDMRLLPRRLLHCSFHHGVQGGEEWHELLGGHASPGKRWRLVYTVGAPTFCGCPIECCIGAGCCSHLDHPVQRVIAVKDSRQRAT